MTLYNITFSKKINSVINNNAIYVLRTFYNIKCHGVIRRQIVRRALLSLRFGARDVVDGDDQFGGNDNYSTGILAVWGVQDSQALQNGKITITKSE